MIGKIVETSINIAISNKIQPLKDITEFLEDRGDLPPILSLKYLKDNIRETVTDKKIYFKRLFSGKITKDKERIKELNNLTELKDNPLFGYLDKLPERNITHELTVLFNFLLDYHIIANIDILHIQNIDYGRLQIRDDSINIIKQTLAYFYVTDIVLFEKKRLKIPFYKSLYNEMSNIVNKYYETNTETHDMLTRRVMNKIDKIYDLDEMDKIGTTG
jgi:hypothetical protein